MGINAFENLPGWLEKSYNAIWTSVVTGTTGIGLAIVKMLTYKPGEPRANYLSLIGIATVLMLMVVFLLHVALKPTPTASDCWQMEYHNQEGTEQWEAVWHVPDRGTRKLSAAQTLVMGPKARAPLVMSGEISNEDGVITFKYTRSDNPSDSCKAIIVRDGQRGIGNIQCQSSGSLTYPTSIKKLASVTI